MSSGGIQNISRIWHGTEKPEVGHLRPRATGQFKALLARLLPRRFSVSSTVAPPSRQTGRQKELQQAYLNKLSQPKLDVTATMMALVELAERLTDKKANIHNLKKTQVKLTDDQLCQLAKNFQRFRAVLLPVNIMIDRVRLDGVTNQEQKRFLTLLRTIAANIDATGEMIESLSAAKGFRAELTGPASPHPAELQSLQRAFAAAWEEVKKGSGERAADLVRNAPSRPMQPVSSSRQDYRTKTWDALAEIWLNFEKRGTFDRAAVTGLLESALQRHGVRGGSARRELANRLVSTIANLTSSGEQRKLLFQLLVAMRAQLKTKPKLLSDAIESILAKEPKQPTVTEDSEDEEPIEYVPDGLVKEKDKLFPDAAKPAGTSPVRQLASPVRQLWDIDDPKELRYAIHDLAKKLRDKHRQVLEHPERWVRHVKRDLLLKGFEPDRVQAILDVVDSVAFGAELVGPSGLLMSAFRQIASESEIASQRLAGDLKIRDDAEVYAKILATTMGWFVDEKRNDPDFDPYDDILELVERQTFDSNLQIYCFFQRHRWLEECLTLPEYVTADFTRQEKLEKMKKVGKLLGELAEPFETVSSALSGFFRQMIGFDPPVTALETKEQVDRLLRIYEENGAHLTPVQALGIYFDQYGRGTESLVEQAAQLPRLANQPAPARPHADSWQSQDDAVDTLAAVMNTLPQTPRSKR
jgi:hypothetical protein